MTRIIVKQLIWDDFNREHIKEHNVTVHEIEIVCTNFLVHQGTKNGRYLIIGRVGSRMLTVIITRKRTGVYYPITARDSAKKEREKLYGKEKQ